MFLGQTQTQKLAQTQTKKKHLIILKMGKPALYLSLETARPALCTVARKMRLKRVVQNV